MARLPKDGFEGVDYSFLDDVGVPQEFKDKFAKLRTEMDSLLTLQQQQVSDAKKNIAVLMSWVTVAANALKIIESIIPLIPVGGTGKVTEDDKNCWLSKLGDLDFDLGCGSTTDANNLSLLSMLKKNWRAQ